MITDFDKGRLYERRELLEMLTTFLEIEDPQLLHKYLEVYRAEVENTPIETIIATHIVIKRI
jgi:hypothetical protein